MYIAYTENQIVQHTDGTKYIVSQDSGSDSNSVWVRSGNPCSAWKVYKSDIAGVVEQEVIEAELLDLLMSYCSPDPLVLEMVKSEYEIDYLRAKLKAGTPAKAIAHDLTELPESTSQE